MDNEKVHEGYLQKAKPCLYFLIPASILLIYPKPLLLLLRPFIRMFRKSYSEVRPTLKKVVFSIDRALTQQELKRSHLFKGQKCEIMTINLFDYSEIKRDSQAKKEDGEMINKIAELQAENTVLKIKMISLQALHSSNVDIAVLVKGKGQMLRAVQAKMYNMKSSEYFKIPNFTQLHELHILQKNKESLCYEHQISKLPRMIIIE